MEEKLNEMKQNVEQLEKKLNKLKDVVNEIQYEVHNMAKTNSGSDLKKFRKSTDENIDEIRKEIDNIKKNIYNQSDDILV